MMNTKTETVADEGNTPRNCEKHNWQNSFPGDNDCPYCECLNPCIEHDAHCLVHGTQFSMPYLEAIDNLVLAPHGAIIKGATITHSGRDAVAKCANPEIATFIAQTCNDAK